MPTITYDFFVTQFETFVTTGSDSPNDARPSITALQNGNQFMMWDANYSGPSPNYINGVIRSANGGTLITDLGNAPSPSSGFQTDAELTTLSNGNVVMVFTDLTDGAGNYDVRMVMFTPSGARVPIGGSTANVMVNEATASDNQFNADVTALSNGGFVVTWLDRDSATDHDVTLRVFDANGNALTGEFTADGSGDDAFDPKVAALSGGGFVVVWAESPSGSPGTTQMVFQRYNASGSTVGAQVVFDTIGTINRSPSVIGTPDGGFAIAYEDSGWTSSTTDTELTVWRFNADGSSRTAFGGFGEGYARVTTAAGNQGDPSLILLDTGQLAVSWDADTTSAPGAGNSGFAVLDANSGSILLNTANLTNGDQVELVALPNGRISLVWNIANGATDGVGADIYQAQVALRRTTQGDATDEILSGDRLRDVINGEGGNDFIAGGPGGNNTMNGGTGFDVVSWFGSALGVTVNLTNQSFNGLDAVGDNVSGFEGYYLTGVGDTFVNNNNGGYIYGFAGNDTINGGTGSDFIDGGAGGDQMNAGAGFDYLSYGNATSGVRLDLTNPGTNTGEAAGDSVTGFEAFYLTSSGDIFIGQTGQNIVFGGGGSDSLFGGVNANDWLFGGDGNDFLAGGVFDDLLSGGAGADTYAGFDSVLDFVSGSDKIQLNASGFGMLAGQSFVNGTTFIAAASPFATTTAGTMLYSTTLGILYFDPDGSGIGAAIALAQFAGAPNITASDFLLI
jgi:hypothetical protein